MIFKVNASRKMPEFLVRLRNFQAWPLWFAMIFTGYCGEPPKIRKLYAQHCAACHDTGAGGAPTRDASMDWKIRRNQDPQEILRAVRKGFVGMPPSGNCTKCSDDELLAIIQYMRSGI
jgi:cytochrome c5